MKQVYLIQGRTQEELLQQATDVLLQAGFTVGMAPGQWETCSQVRHRLRIPRRTWAHKIARKWLGKVLREEDIERGPSGRILRIRSNAEFEHWMTPREVVHERHEKHEIRGLQPELL